MAGGGPAWSAFERGIVGKSGENKTLLIPDGDRFNVIPWLNHYESLGYQKLAYVEVEPSLLIVNSKHDACGWAVARLPDIEGNFVAFVFSKKFSQIEAFNKVRQRLRRKTRV